MSQARIAIPSSLPGGLEAQVGAHFGHCELYTIVDVEAGLITRVSALPSVPHEQGGCLAAVNHLADHGVTVLLSGGMGLRPLMGFNQAGIEVFRGAQCPTVDAAVRGYLKGELQAFTREFTCAGGSHGHDPQAHQCNSDQH